MSNRSSIRWNVTPSSGSPFRTCHAIGDGPRWRGSRDGWLFTQPRRGTASASGVRRHGNPRHRTKSRSNARSNGATRERPGGGWRDVQSGGESNEPVEEGAPVGPHVAPPGRALGRDGEPATGSCPTARANAAKPSTAGCTVETSTIRHPLTPQILTARLNSMACRWSGCAACWRTPSRRRTNLDVGRPHRHRRPLPRRALTTARFDGLSLLEQHRLVNEALVVAVDTTAPSTSCGSRRRKEPEMGELTRQLQSR